MEQCRDLQTIRQRVRYKFASYERYNFSTRCDDFLKAFFDLAQEFDSLEDYYRICVAVPLEMTGINSALYLFDEEVSGLFLVCDSIQGVLVHKQTAPVNIVYSRTPYSTDSCFIIPVYAKAPPSEGHFSDPSSKVDTPGERFHELQESDGGNRVLGMYSVCNVQNLSESDLFFFTKYANRIGYNLHNRLLALANINHLKFINTLVMDIEHNVIVPNMYFRHLFNQLRKKITELDQLREKMRELVESDHGKHDCSSCLTSCDNLSADLFSYHHDLVKHHANISLFLESLFRREHFERGHLVLHPQKSVVEKEIILPQLEHYANRFKTAGITVVRPKNMKGEEYPIKVDVGLLSQVYANLFSNAIKYSREITDHQGIVRKAVSYGRETVDNFPRPGGKGIKFNVFSTGSNITADEREQIFQEGVRGRDCGISPGTGHGLSFIRHVIVLHGGIVGCEATEQGNNFYFILPA